ncbi:MAG: DUF3592 domain-containing protein [Anaerolineales bacterium]|nr:DUF3592 domain-containing protein [Anaerolineales bacterium]
MAILFGILLAGFGLFMLWRSLQLRRKGLFTIGTVTRVEWRRRVPVVTVRFMTTRNKTIIFSPGGWTSLNTSPFYQVGNPVPVLYDPNNPHDAVIYTFDFMWILPLALVGIGCFFIYQGFVH